MFGAIGDAIDTASSVVGGGHKTEQAPSNPARYIQADQLDEAREGQGGAHAPNIDNALDTDEQIEFIHYGRVHTDWAKNFAHDSARDDDAALNLDQKKYRALVYRACLQREAILYTGFISACQAVIKEYNDNKGPLGEIGAAASSLLGGGGAPSGPRPADLDQFVNKVSAAGGSINVEAVKYLDTHKAGVDLFQAWWDYNAYAGANLKPDTTKGALGSLPGVTGPVAVVQGILFKAFDIYLAMYLKLRDSSERKIMDACYRIGIDSLRKNFAPVYMVWSGKPDAGKKNAGGSGTGDEPASAAPVQAFLNGGESDNSPGKPYVEAVFGAFSSAPDWIIDSLRAVLQVQALPAFVVTFIQEATVANLALLEAVYLYYLQHPGDTIDEQLLLAAGEEAITRRILALLVDLLPVLSFLQSDNQLASVQGMGLSGKDIADKGLDWVNETFGKDLGVLVQSAVKQLREKMNAAQTSAGNPVTMEVFLGQLPYWVSLSVRNTIFPVWDLIVQKLFGSLAGPMGAAISPGKSMLGTANDATGKAEDASSRLNTATDQLAKGVNQDNAAGFVDTVFGGGNSGDPGGGPPPGFPGSDRKNAGSGVQIEPGDPDAAGHMWETAEQSAAE